MRIAALQMVARAGDVEANIAILASAAADAAAGGATLLVAPELAMTGYGAGEAIAALAEPADGAFVARLAALANSHSIAIVAGFAEREGARVYNSAAFVDFAGRRSIYRKRQLFGDYERAHFQPGDDPPEVIETGGMRTGMLICYDVEFPEAVRALSLAGADLVVVPTALPQGSHAAFIAERIVPARAFENQIAIVYANHAGADGRFAYAGLSTIVLPDGTEGARAGAEGEGLINADYEPGRFAVSRTENPYLRDLRPGLYR